MQKDIQEENKHKKLNHLSLVMSVSVPPTKHLSSGVSPPSTTYVHTYFSFITFNLSFSHTKDPSRKWWSFDNICMMAVGRVGRNLMGPLLAVNFVVHLIVLGLAGWSLEKYIDGEQDHPRNPLFQFPLSYTQQITYLIL